MAALIDVGTLDGLTPEHGATVNLGSNTIALFKVGRVIHAIEGYCLRCGASLAEGRLHGRIVECQGCDWRYELATGSVIGLTSLRLHTFDVRVVAGKVVIEDV